MIIKALQEGEHHALLLLARLKDNTRAARPGVWPAAAHPANLELQLAVPSAVYHWLQAFHDLRWSGKPDHQIGATHWQAWLQADAQRDAVRSLGPAPATRALDAAAPDRALAPHRVPLANLPSKPAPESAIQKSAPLPPARGRRNERNAPCVRTSTTQARRCWNTWRGTQCTLQPLWTTRRRPPTSAKEGHRSPRGTPRTPGAPPPQAADHADGEEEAPGAAPGTGGAAQQGSIPAGLAPLTPLWAALGTGSPHPMAPAHPGALADPADPAAMPMLDS